MVALDGQKVKYVSIDEAFGKMKSVPVDSDIIQTAKDLGISFCEPD
jgi:ATP-dependent phosphofructokinase / diphosphate-dependent phosphofructokinase